MGLQGGLAVCQGLGLVPFGDESEHADLNAFFSYSYDSMGIRPTVVKLLFVLFPKDQNYVCFYLNQLYDSSGNYVKCKDYLHMPSSSSPIQACFLFLRAIPAYQIK